MLRCPTTWRRAASVASFSVVPSGAPWDDPPGAFTRIVDAEEELLKVADPVLDGQLDVNDVEVPRDHEGLCGDIDGLASAGEEPQVHAAGLSDSFNVALANGPRPVPVQAGFHGPGVPAE